MPTEVDLFRFLLLVLWWQWLQQQQPVLQVLSLHQRQRLHQWWLPQLPRLRDPQRQLRPAAPPQRGRRWVQRRWNLCPQPMLEKRCQQSTPELLPLEAAEGCNRSPLTCTAVKCVPGSSVQQQEDPLDRSGVTLFLPGTGSQRRPLRELMPKPGDAQAAAMSKWGKPRLQSVLVMPPQKRRWSTKAATAETMVQISSQWQSL